MTEDRVGELLRVADPVQEGDLSSGSVHAALAALRDDIRDLDRVSVPITRRRGRRRLVLGLAAIAVAGSATVAAAGAAGVFTHTGRQAEGGENGTGEYLRLDAPDAGAVLREMGADIPLPPGATFDGIEDRLPDEPVEQATSGVMAFLEQNAACMWGAYWLDARSRGDVTALAEAQVGIDRLQTRPRLTSTAASGEPPESQRRYWARWAAAARSGDPQTLRDAGYSANCTDVPQDN